MTKYNLDKIKETIALLSSMINCGDTHSNVSRKAVDYSLDVLIKEVEED